MVRSVHTVLAAFLIVLPVMAGEPPTLKADAVDLVAGKESPGKAELFVDHAGYRYLFATEANKSAFQKSPEKFEIADGGACGRMGPLSGRGSPERYAVHEGRIYLFASPQCRDGFLKNPLRCIESDDPKPEPVSPAAAKRGKELIELALRGLGGAEKVDAVKSYEEQIDADRKSGEKTYKFSDRRLVAFPARYLEREAWDDSWFGSVLSDAGGAFTSAGEEPRAMVASQRAALARTFARVPLVMLKSRGKAGFEAFAAGEGKVGDAAVEYLVTYFDGAKIKWGIDAKSGRILSAAFRGRGLRSSVGEVEVVFDDFREVGGLTLPHARRASFDGERAESMDAAVTKIVVNGPVDEEAFRMPRQTPVGSALRPGALLGVERASCPFVGPQGRARRPSHPKGRRYESATWRRYKFPRRACSRSSDTNSALKFPCPNPRQPCRSITSKNSVGRSCTGWVKIWSR
ncbi:YHS domain protein [Phycisphaerae bacterium RAS1]|nr:YHS domain protein [Phycisphaerae bacterium RAS1]